MKFSAAKETGTVKVSPAGKCLTLITAILIITWLAVAVSRNGWAGAGEVLSGCGISFATVIFTMMKSHKVIPLWMSAAICMAVSMAVSMAALFLLASGTVPASWMTTIHIWVFVPWAGLLLSYCWYYKNWGLSSRSYRYLSIAVTVTFAAALMVLAFY